MTTKANASIILTLPSQKPLVSICCLKFLTSISFKLSLVWLVVLPALILSCSAESSLPQAHTPSTPAAPTSTRPSPAPPKPQSVPVPSPTGTIYFSADRDGRWEIYAAPAAGDWSQLTRDFSPARAPSLSPDGKQLAFQSHKDGNWEIYVVRLDGGQAIRVTNDPAYDGSPTWSPDGRRIAFESYRAGDLDIWTMNADGSDLFNLTAKEPNYDYGPAWSPQGSWIAYTSLASGHKQIMITSPDGAQSFNLSQDRFDDEQPSWSPDGSRLAFVSNREGCERVTESIALNGCQRREIYVGDFDGKSLSNLRQVTYGGHDTHPTWSPDGEFLAFISPRPDGQRLYLAPAAGGAPQDAVYGANTLSPVTWVDSAAWAAGDIGAGGTSVEYEPLYVEKPVAAATDEGHPYEMQEMPEIYLAPSWGQMSSRVANSLRMLRARVNQDTGRDFLATLSDMTRDLKSPCGVSCDNLSWHKAGRAIDTRLEYLDSGGRNLLQVVREDELGETYWRMYVRTSAQDGTMGEPLKDAPWDLSYRARAQIASDQGGMQAPIPSGYYVDFTELAHDYGWERISAHDDPDFDWRSNMLATEYWHYQKTDGLNWYDAMNELYSRSQLASELEWNKVGRNWQVQDVRLYLKGLQPPPNAWKWFSLIPAPIDQ